MVGQFPLVGVGSRWNRSGCSRRRNLRGGRCFRCRLGIWSRRRPGATVQLNWTCLTAASLLVLVKRGINLLIAIGGNGNQTLAFGRTIGCQSNPGVRIDGLLRAVIVELSRFEV